MQMDTIGQTRVQCAPVQAALPREATVRSQMLRVGSTWSWAPGAGPPRLAAGSRATAEALLRSSLSTGELGEEGTAMASRERVSALMNLPMRR